MYKFLLKYYKSGHTDAKIIKYIFEKSYGTYKASLLPVKNKWVIVIFEPSRLPLITVTDIQNFNILAFGTNNNNYLEKGLGYYDITDLKKRTPCTMSDLKHLTYSQKIRKLEKWAVSL